MNYLKFKKISNYYYIMDNRYWENGCPALMQDGRFLTNYIRGAVFDQFIRSVNEIKTATEYRQYLQSHGDNIMNKERAYLMKNNSCTVNGKCLKISGNAPFNVLPCATCGDEKQTASKKQ
jgi:hypothetical protein